MNRIQRKRTKGFRSPDNCIYVGRPTIWGNPFIVGRDGTAEECVSKYREYITKLYKTDWVMRECVNDLRGHDLSCWCSLSQPCHADVLIELVQNVEKGLI